MKTTWYDTARKYIAELDADLPADMPFKERRKAVRAAYPWGQRRMWPYKAWCRAQREYLARFLPPDARDGQIDSLPKTPLEQMIEKTIEAEKLGKTDGR